LEMSVQEFLNSISNPRTRKGYRFGLNKFVEWFGKPAEEILAMRQEDLTQRPGENLVEYRNRAARFEKEIEKFHSYLLEKGYSINSARNMSAFQVLSDASYNAVRQQSLSNGENNQKLSLNY
jgi:hypothetical protein